MKLLRLFIITALTAVSLSFAAPAFAGGVKVLILPFDMHGAENISGLRRDVMETLATAVDDAGGLVTGMERVKRAMLDEGITEFSEETAFKIVETDKADYAILGSVTVLGESLNVDWRILDIHDRRPLKYYFKTSEKKRDLLKKLRQETIAAYAVMLTSIAERPIDKSGVVDNVTIIGNKRVDTEAILKRITSMPGEAYSPDAVKEDIRGIFGMGYFDDVTVDFSETASGRELRFTVKERPYLKSIQFIGNKEVDEEKIREVVTIKENTTLDRRLVKENAEIIRLLYVSEGFNLSTVEPETTYSGLDATVTYNIEEGDEVKVKRITIIGNEKYSDRKLRKIMKTKKKGLFSFISGSGKFNEFDFNDDISKLMSHYYDHGHIQADITKQTVQLSEDKKWFYITIALVEGAEFSIDRIDVTGDILTTRADIFEEFKLKKGDVFNRSKVSRGIDAVTFLYGDDGYANVEVLPRTALNQEAHTVDLTLDITKNKPVHIERIDISGNVKTRDKVIRRQLEVGEGDLYSSSGLKRSRGNLKRLGYFEEVEFLEYPGSTRDRLKLDVDVEERATGAFTVGVGFSSVDKIVGTASVSQSNLMGTGIVLQVAGTISATSSNYTLSFTEPWLFDKPLSVGFDIYNTRREFPDFDMQTTGFALRAGFPIFSRYTRGFVTYKFETVEVTDVSALSAQLIVDQEGTRDVSSVNLFFKRDTRNDAYFPTEGATYSLSNEYAGGFMGGNTNYVKFEARALKFFSLPWATAFSTRAMAGYVDGFGGQATPLYQKYYLGGMSSLRGFATRQVGPKDPETKEFIGGDTALVLNFEYVLPLFSPKMRGVLFYDTGNAYAGGVDFSDLRQSAGVGIRWLSPFGPLRLEFGVNLDKRDGEKGSQVEIAMGTSF